MLLCARFVNNFMSFSRQNLLLTDIAGFPDFLDFLHQLLAPRSCSLRFRGIPISLEQNPKKLAQPQVRSLSGRFFLRFIVIASHDSSISFYPKSKK